MSPFVDNEILPILVLAILVAASISMLAERQRMAIVGVFEVASRVVFGVIRLIGPRARRGSPAPGWSR